MSGTVSENNSTPALASSPGAGKSRPARRHFQTLALAAAAAAMHAGEQAEAATVGIHFRYIYNGGIGATINTAGSQVFAGVPAALWNNMAPIDLNQVTPLSQSGQFLTTPGATGISLDYSAQNAYGPYGAPTDDNAAYFSYLDDTVGGSHSGYTVTVHGLSSFLSAGQTYSIEALQATDTTNATFSNVEIYSGVGTTGPLLATLTSTGALQLPDGAGTYGNTTNSPQLTADTITIVGDPRNGDQRSTLAGFTVQSVPEPGSLVLIAGGLAFLLRRRSGRPRLNDHHA